MPHVDVDVAVSEIADLFESWDVVCLFAADVDRRLSFSALATIDALDVSDGSGELDARFTVHTRAFTNPEVGSAGTYWHPTHRLDLTIGARGDFPRPIPYLAVTLGRSDRLALYLDNAVTLQAGIPGFGMPPFATAEWAGAKRFRLAHLFYLDLAASAGSSLLEALPTEFMFSLDGLHAFALPPYGHHQVYGRAEAVFPPLARNQGYAILNLTRLEDVTASAFVQGGRTWGGCDLVCESGIRIEAGAMFTFRLDAFLGSSIEFSVGYAYPLFGLDGEAATFIEFATSF